jgi:hypothetical protein
VAVIKGNPWVDWGYDPDTSIRVLWVPAYYIVPPTVLIEEVSIQDILDTCRSFSDDLENIDKPRLVFKSGGEEEITSELSNALTVTLNNTVIAFQRPIDFPQSGTVTTAVPWPATELHDSSAFFLSTVARGSIITNNSDFQSRATVLQVVNDNFLRCTPLSGGGDDAFEVGDAYTIDPMAARTITGGNLVAIDYNGVPINPILPTYGTHVRLSQSAAATLIEAPTAPISVVLQSFNYSPGADTLTGMVWVESNGVLVPDPASVAVEFLDENDNVLFTMADSAADSRGFFKVTKAAPGLLSDKMYHTKATVTLADTDVVSGGLGAFTVG